MRSQTIADYDRAVALYQKGRLAEALANFERALKFSPNLAAAHAYRSLVLRDLRRPAEALASIDKAISLQPDYADAWNIRSAVLRDMNRLDEALASIDKVVALTPGSSQAWSNRGTLLHDAKRLEEALASIDKAIAIQSNVPDVWNNRGVVLRDLNRLVEALASVDKALSLQPRYADAWNNRGLVLRRRRRLDEALASFDRAVALRPDYADAWANRGHVLSALKRPQEAAVSYSKAQALDPRGESVMGEYLFAKMAVCDWDGFDAKIDTCTALIRSGKIVSPFPLLSLLDDPPLQKMAARAFAGAVFPRHDALGPFPKRNRREKIRVGYYSADFLDHATSYLIAELLEAHDAARFELYGFSLGPSKQDAMRQRVSAALGRFVDVSGMSDGNVARLSREYGVDIAVDLKGYTFDSRPGIFAHGCAPVQVQYLGYPGTMGADYIDYIVADRRVIPPDSRIDYTEKVIWLPHSYQANDSRQESPGNPPTRQAAGLPESGFVFCSFNNSYKISPSVFDSWMRILKAVDGSLLWLLEDSPGAAENLRKEAAIRDVDARRLIFAKRLPRAEHLARQRLADLFLDTWPCNAHTTASDALWAGLPLLTCMGKSFASRVAGSLLNAVGLGGLITHSKDDYEALAIALAFDPVRLASCRKTLADSRKTAPLFDGRLTARHLEAGYEAIHARFLAGLPPDNIEIPA
jgi:predicted O-linked N-acetylglucosamine transferase (SPINDLY family)